MKVTEHNTIACTGSLHPHGHTQQHEGPWSLRIGTRSQPMVVRDWKNKQVLLNIEQPNDEDNFTLIQVMFLKSGQKKPSFVAGVTFNKVRWYRRNGKATVKQQETYIEVRLKRKLGNPFRHPIPIGKYNGSCMYDADGGFAVFTLQAMTLRKKPEPSKPKTIITPGDTEYDVTLGNAKRTLSGIDGLGGRGVDASGLRDGELPDSVPPRSSGKGMGRSVWTPGDR